MFPVGLRVGPSFMELLTHPRVLEPRMMPPAAPIAFKNARLLMPERPPLIVDSSAVETKNIAMTTDGAVTIPIFRETNRFLSLLHYFYGDADD
jgi:hypothetical protein